ncbi:MAG: hypothetical protein OEW37_01440 [Rhodospirillaceae bacterium]|nr:hypothetical protein [Rhodospirillaceae bacterium]
MTSSGKHLIRASSFAFLVTLLSGCTFYQALPKPILSTIGNIFPIDTALVMTTDKTIADHVVSGASGKNCKTTRQEQGRTYCVEDEPNPAPAVTCYNTIGDVTCYSQPDANIPNEKIVGSAKYPGQDQR